MVRRSNRSVLNASCTACFGISNRRLPVSVFDLAVHGCRLDEVPSSAVVGTRVLLTLGSVGPVESRITWSERGRGAGLEFAQPLHPAVIDHLVALARRKHGPDGRTGSLRIDLSPIRKSERELRRV